MAIGLDRKHQARQLPLFPGEEPRGSIVFWDRNDCSVRTLPCPHPVNDVSWSPDNKQFVAFGGRLASFWSVLGQELGTIEGHSGEVRSGAFSPDGSLVIAKSLDGTIRCYRADSYEEVWRLAESFSKQRNAAIAFHPTESVVATFGEDDTVIRIWEVGAKRLASIPGSRRVIYTSAKIVLVGESNVGKSCLAMRLAEDRYPKDDEHGTTHGMRFWPMEAEELHSAAKPPEGQRRDVVLWDFGGQDEYQLVHQMFLHDTTLALVLIDPTRGRAAMDEARDWNKRLEKHLGKDRAVKLLVGAKVDRKRDLIDQNILMRFVESAASRRSSI